MDQTRIHLFIAHLPVFGAVLGLIVLLLGMRWKNKQTIKAAHILLLITALGAVAAYFSGEGAEDTVENIAGISEEAVEEHEDAGKFAFYSFIPLGLLSLAALIFPNKTWSKRLPAVSVIVTLICSVIAIRTASLGGKIRHTEIDNPPVTEVRQQKAGKPDPIEKLAPDLRTDDGKKWKANPETSTAIENMQEQVRSLPANPSPEMVENLQLALEDEFGELVRQCTMTGEAHDQLHNYILPLRDQIESLDENDAAIALPALRDYLSAYHDFFE